MEQLAERSLTRLAAQPRASECNVAEEEEELLRGRANEQPFCNRDAVGLTNFGNLGKSS